MRWPLPLILALGCGRTSPSEGQSTGAEQISADRQAEREQMVRTQLWARGISDERVLAAMASVPRHRFVPADLADLAYADRALPIGHEVTISQPYVVAWMTALAKIEAGSKVLEVGTGSGYQAAILAQLGAHVYSIERVEALADRARARLAELGYEVEVRFGDGRLGWPEHAPFDAILTTAAPDDIPQALLEQLAEGGRLILPLGAKNAEQSMVVIERRGDEFERSDHGAVMFVPLLPGTTRD